MGDNNLLNHARQGSTRPPTLLLFFLLSSLCGCVTSYPRDVSLLSVEPTRSNDIPGFPHRSPDRPVLKLNFQSAFDLAGYTRDSAGTSVHASFCDEALQFRTYPGSPAPNLAWIFLYADNGSQIETATFSPDLPGSVDRTRVIMRSCPSSNHPRQRARGHTPDHSWDLRADPHDVCVRIQTLKIWPLLQSRSNVMRIPATVLRAALGPSLP